MSRLVYLLFFLLLTPAVAQESSSYFRLNDEVFEVGQLFRLDSDPIWEYKGEILTADAIEALEEVVDFMKMHPRFYFEIVVYADCRREDMDHKLEQIRAEALQEYFVYMGIDDKRLFPKGMPYPDYVRIISEQDSLLCPWLEVGQEFECSLINKKKSDKKVSAQYRIFNRAEIKIISIDGFLKLEEEE